MLYIFPVLLFASALLYRKIGRSWLFPPAVFSLYWAVIIMVTSFFYFRSYILSADAGLVFTIGCICFGIGGGIAILLFKRNRDSRMQLGEGRRKTVQLFIILFNISLFAIFPIFILALREASYSLHIESFAIGARLAMGQPYRAGVSRLFFSLGSIAEFLAFYAAWLYRGSRSDKTTLIVAVAGPLALSIPTFARTPVYTLMIGVLAILIFRRNISKVRALVIGMLALILMLGMGALLGKNPGINSFKLPLEETLDNLGVYYLGGPIGFGQVIDNPSAVGEKGLSLRFFTQAIQSAGINIYLPSNKLGYSQYGLGNIYTAFYAYWLDWRWPGIVVFALLFGFISSFVYIMASRKNIIAGAALGLVFTSLLNSAVGDGLLASAVPWLLIIALGCLFIYAPLPDFLLRKKIKIGRKPRVQERKID